MSPEAAGTIAATIAVAVLVIDYLLERGRERRELATIRAAAQGTHPCLGWFEANWGRSLHPDVLYAVVATREHLLLLRVGGQAHRGTRWNDPPDRKVRFAEALGATWPDVGLGLGRDDLALPVAEILRATLRERRWFRQFVWQGAATLRIERRGRAPLELVIEDRGDLAECARVLEAALGGRAEIDLELLAANPAPDRTLRDLSGRRLGHGRPPAATASGPLRSLSVRTGLTGSVAAVLLCGLGAAALWSIRGEESPPMQSVTARIVACTETDVRKGRDFISMTLRSPPYLLRCSLDRESREPLREACRRGATIRARYTGGGNGEHFAHVESIAYVNGPVIVSEAEATRSRHESRLIGMVLTGLLAGSALGLLLRAIGWWLQDAARGQDAGRSGTAARLRT
jgi:hypothetical protein